MCVVNPTRPNEPHLAIWQVIAIHSVEAGISEPHVNSFLHLYMWTSGFTVYHTHLLDDGFTVYYMPYSLLLLTKRLTWSPSFLLTYHAPLLFVLEIFLSLSPSYIQVLTHLSLTSIDHSTLLLWV